MAVLKNIYDLRDKYDKALIEHGSKQMSHIYVLLDRFIEYYHTMKTTVCSEVRQESCDKCLYCIQMLKDLLPKWEYDTIRQFWIWEIFGYGEG